MKGDKGVGRTKGRGLEECFHEPLLYLLSMDKCGGGGQRGGVKGGFLRAARLDRTARSCYFTSCIVLFVGVFKTTRACCN